MDGTCLEIIRANTRRRNNTSGVPGVEWMKDKRKWRSSICFKGKRRYLGSFDRFDDAVRARKRAEEELFDTFLDVCGGKQPERARKDMDEVSPPVGGNCGN